MLLYCFSIKCNCSQFQSMNNRCQFRKRKLIFQRVRNSQENVSHGSWILSFGVMWISWRYLVDGADILDDRLIFIGYFLASTFISEIPNQRLSSIKSRKSHSDWISWNISHKWFSVTFSLYFGTCNGILSVLILHIRFNSVWNIIPNNLQWLNSVIQEVNYSSSLSIRWMHL